MCRSINSLLVPVLLLAGLSNSIVLCDDDISLSELPKAVRFTIERETKGFEIEDIDRDNDDGKVVYEVEAESTDGRRNEMAVAEDGSLIKMDAQLRSKDLPAQIAKAVKKAAQFLGAMYSIHSQLP